MLRVCVPFLSHTCHHKRCNPDSLQVWLQKWPKPGFLLPYLQKTALKRPFYAGMAILKNLCAEEGGRSGVCDADFEEIARTVGAFVKDNGAVLLGAAVKLLTGALVQAGEQGEVGIGKAVLERVAIKRQCHPSS